MADLLKPTGKKDNSRRRGIPALAKEQRRREAQERQAKYDKLSLKEKLAQPHLGAKERRKLEAKLQKGA